MSTFFDLPPAPDPGPSPESMLRELQAAVNLARTMALERLVEESLQSGEHGVLWDERHGVGTVSRFVPYGEVIIVNSPHFDLRETL